MIFQEHFAYVDDVAARGLYYLDRCPEAYISVESVRTRKATFDKYVGYAMECLPRFLLSEEHDDHSDLIEGAVISMAYYYVELAWCFGESPENPKSEDVPSLIAKHPELLPTFQEGIVRRVNREVFYNPD